MQKLVYQNANGEELDLTDGVKFGVTTWEGFSNCNLTVQTQTVPFADGSVYLDGLLGERELAITVAVNDKGDLGLRYQLKRELISMLNPKLGEGYLIYTNDYLSRRIKVVPYLPTFGNKNIDVAGTLKASCSFKACNPYWEDVDATEIKIIGYENIENIGDVPVNCEIELVTDNITNPVLKNVTTGKKIQLNGTFNDNISIDTEIGRKTVISKKLDYSIDDTSNNFYGCISVGSKKIVVGDYGIIVIEGDKKTLIKYINISIRAIAYSEDLNLYCAVGQSGTILTSSNLKEWTSETSGVSTYLLDVAFLNGKFYAVGNSGVILRSSDGHSWESIENSFASPDFTKIIYSKLNSVYIIAGSSGSVYTTADFETITAKGTDSSSSITDIIETDSYIVVTSSSTIRYTENLTTWNIADIDWGTATYDSLRSLAYNEITGISIAVGNRGNKLISYDILHWKQADNSYVSTLNSIYTNNEDSTFLLVGNNGCIMESDNGVTFTNVTSNFYARNSKTFQCIGKDINDFYLGGEHYLYKSSDLQTFEQVSLPSESYFIIRKIKYFEETNTLIVLTKNTSNYSVILVKIGDNDFVENVLTIKDTLYDVTYGNGKYCAVGDNGAIMTSEDSINWTKQTSPTSYSIISVDYSDNENVFKCCSNESGEVLSSNNLTTWSTEQLPYPYLNCIRYIEQFNSWYVLGSAGRLFIKNIDDWVRLNVISMSVSLYDIIYSKNLNRLFITGDKGNILSSSNGRQFESTVYNEISQYKSIIENGNSVVLIGVLSHQIAYMLINSYFSELENIINLISTDSDMNLTLEKGNNKIIVGGQNGSVSARLTYRNRYVGV